jgi:hypothetical protein
MVALYKWMNWAIKKEVAAEQATQETNTLGSKSVLWTNPTETQKEETVEKMDGKAYLNYLKQNMGQLGLG